MWVAIPVDTSISAETSSLMSGISSASIHRTFLTQIGAASGGEGMG